MSLIYITRGETKQMKRKKMQELDKRIGGKNSTNKEEKMGNR
jgi:hypothetical protein